MQLRFIDVLFHREAHTEMGQPEAPSTTQEVLHPLIRGMFQSMSLTTCRGVKSLTPLLLVGVLFQTLAVLAMMVRVWC